MDTVDESTIKPTPVQENEAGESKTTQQDDLSWLVENNTNDVTSSEKSTENNITTTTTTTSSNATDVTATASDDVNSWEIPSMSEEKPSESNTTNEVTSSAVPLISEEKPIENNTTTSINSNDLSSWEIPSSSTSDEKPIENNATIPTNSNDVTSWTIPTVFDQNPIDNQEQLYTLPPTVDEVLTDNFSNSALDSVAEDESSSSFFIPEQLPPSNEQMSRIEALNKKREQELAAKDAEERRNIESLRQQAKTDLDNWYKERQRQMEQKLKTLKNEENDLYTKPFENSSKDACDWSKVLRLVDFTDGKQVSQSKRDLTRMKTCIFNAKRITDKKNVSNGSEKK